MRERGGNLNFEFFLTQKNPSNLCYLCAKT